MNSLTKNLNKKIFFLLLLFLLGVGGDGGRGLE